MWLVNQEEEKKTDIEKKLNLFFYIKKYIIVIIMKKNRLAFNEEIIAKYKTTWLAEYFGVTVQTITSWERRKSVPYVYHDKLQLLVFSERIS